MIMIMTGKMNAHHVDIHQPGHFPCPGEQCGKVEQLVFFFLFFSKFWNVTRWFEMFFNILFFEMSALRSSQARTNRHPTIQSRKTISIKQWYKLSLMMFVICCFSGTAAPPQRWEGQHYADVEFKSNNALWRGLQTMATSSQMVFEQPFNVG